MEDTKNELLNKNSKPPYLLGFLGLIPFVGFFVGVALILYGVYKYKDRKLIIIGIADILFTIIVYSSIFYISFVSDFGKEGWTQNAQVNLNSLIKEIEFYKSQNGKYPNSLKQLEKQSELVFIYDPTQSEIGTKYFNYINLGKKYQLYSSGVDQTKNTSDDIYPQVKNLKNIGWVKPATAGNSQ